MNAYLKTALICVATIAIVVRVPALKGIVIGA